MSALAWTVVQGDALTGVSSFPAASTAVTLQFSSDLSARLTDPLSLKLCAGSSISVTLPMAASAFNEVFFAQTMTVPLVRHLRSERNAALYLASLCAATIDLPRVLRTLGIPCYVHLPEFSSPMLSGLTESARSWMIAALQAATGLTASSHAVYRDWQAVLPNPPPFVDDILVEQGQSENDGTPFAADEDVSPSRYLQYELAHRHHPLLAAMAEPDVQHFAACSSVLDLGCGVGIFLWLLSRQGVSAVGIERDPWLAQYAREMGLDVHEADALQYLRDAPATFDGVYCSHFIEHLPVEAAQALLAGIARVLTPGGLAVLVFPDPESIRSQLLGFWRDPEHVRFYHPELVATMAASVGLVCEWTSYENQPHRVVSFSEHPEPLPIAESMASPMNSSWLAKLKRRLGLVDTGQIDALITENRALRAQIEALDQRTQKLWQVNQTWAWQDNAVLRLRKPA